MHGYRTRNIKQDQSLNRFLFLFFCVCSNLPLQTANAATFPVCRKGFFESFQYFSVLLTLIFILSVLLTPAPFVNLSVDTLAKAKRLTHFYSVALLLEKWFACFPTSGDSLRLAYFPYFPVMQRRLFLFNPLLYFLFFSYKKTDFFFPGKLK